MFLLTLAFLMKDSITSVAPVMATALLLALRWLVEVTTGPIGGWIGDRFGARPSSIVNGACWWRASSLIAADHELVGALMIVMTRGMFNTLIPVLVIERGHGERLSLQASYSTWRDFGAAVGPLSAPWLFLNVPQRPLYAALAMALGLSGYFCLVRRGIVVGSYRNTSLRCRTSANTWSGRRPAGRPHVWTAGMSARRNGLVAFSSPSSDGTVASPRARAASTAAERVHEASGCRSRR